MHQPQHIGMGGAAIASNRGCDAANRRDDDWQCVEGTREHKRPHAATRPSTSPVAATHCKFKTTDRAHTEAATGARAPPSPEEEKGTANDDERARRTL